MSHGLKVSRRSSTGVELPLGVSVVITPDGDDADVDIGSDHAHAAADVTYDNTTSGLTADDVQEAIDELAAGGSGFDPGWFIAEDFGAVHDGTTDDTAAIQAAIDACHAAGGGTIFFHAGIYQIDGALQDTSAYNAQLTIPFQSFSASPVPIRFLGPTPARVYGGEPPDGGEAILRTSWDGSISGHPAMLSAGPWRDLTTARSNVALTFEGLSIIAPDNPKLTALQLTCASVVSIRQVTVRTDSEVPADYPTNTNAAGVEMPFGLSYADEEISNLAVLNFYTGLIPSEQTHGQAYFAFCTVGVHLVAQQDSAPYIRWPNSFPRLTFVSVETCIKATGTGKRWITAFAAFEHDDDSPIPFETVYDIDDNDNLLHGLITVHPTDYITGPTDLRVNNAQNLSYHQPDQKFWRLNSQVHIPTGTDPSANPFSGYMLYAASATGKPTTRSSTGTVTTIMREGDTAGGDLSGTYPNPTVVDDSHSHTAATAPGGGGGAVLLVSGHSVPFTFDEILQESDGSDFLYASA